MGDVKMLAMIGAFLGWQLTLRHADDRVGGRHDHRRRRCIATGRGTMKYALPFGTFLAIGAAVSAAVGQHDPQLVSQPLVSRWTADAGADAVAVASASCRCLPLPPARLFCPPSSCLICTVSERSAIATRPAERHSTAISLRRATCRRSSGASTLRPADVELLTDLGAVYEARRRSGIARRPCTGVRSRSILKTATSTFGSATCCSQRGDVGGRAAKATAALARAAGPRGRPRADAPRRRGRSMMRCGRRRADRARPRAATRVLLRDVDLLPADVQSVHVRAVHQAERQRGADRTSPSGTRDLHWLVLSMTALTLAPFLERSRARWIGWAYLAASVALGAMAVHAPALARLGSSSATSLILAVVATIPPIWLAVFDHVATAGPRAREPIAVATERDESGRACWLTAAVHLRGVRSASLPVRLRHDGRHRSADRRHGDRLGGVGGRAPDGVHAGRFSVLTVVAGLAALDASARAHRVLAAVGPVRGCDGRRRCFA